MSNFLSVVIAILVMTGCSSSVRPLYPGEQQAGEDMLAQARALGLALSDAGTSRLAHALVQASDFCAVDDKALKVRVAAQNRHGTAVPVVHVHCE